MGIALVTIKTTLNGEEWSNTWGLRVGETGNVPITDEELATIMGYAPLTDETTSPGADTTPYAGPLSPLAAIIGFHRLVTYEQATVSSLYVSDGRKNGALSVYATLGLGFPCLRPNSVPDSIVPLSLIWDVTRNPGLYSTRPGRLQLRAALADSAVKPGTRSGVQWTDSAWPASMATLLATSVANSNIDHYFSGSFEETPSDIGIPHYGNSLLQPGELIDVVPMISLTSNKPASRQLTRGRRRSAP